MKKLDSYIKEEFNRRSNQDRRKKVDWYLVEYRDSDGIAYRKAFEFIPGTKFDTVKSSIPLIIN